VHQGERTDFGNNVTEVERVTGNSRAYSLSRVQRECDPETVAAVMSGVKESRSQTAPVRDAPRR